MISRASFAKKRKERQNTPSKKKRGNWNIWSVSSAEEGIGLGRG